MEQTWFSPLSKQGFPVLLLLLSLTVCGFTFWFSPSWETINKYIDKKYPKVVHITVDQLREDMRQGQTLYLLDVREVEEYAVSHIAGSINRTDPTSISLPKDARVVSYCSVGIRSAAFTRRLQEKGFTQAVNLRGSIFEWANKGYPLVQGEKATRYVHPFNKRWGVLIDSELHRYGDN